MIVKLRLIFVKDEKKTSTSISNINPALDDDSLREAVENLKIYSDTYFNAAEKLTQTAL